MDKYLNKELSPKERAADLLSKLDLEEKMAQVVCVFAEPADMLENAVSNGMGQVSTLGFTKCKSMEEAALWQRQLQTMIMEKSRYHIPAIFHMEGICGAYVQGSTAFPSGVNRGATFDPELEERIGSVVSRQEAAYGITQVLAPVLDIARDPRMGRQSEPYGEDPTLAGVMGAAFTRGIQQTQTAGRHPEAVAKHFLGFHSSQGGIHSAAVDSSERQIKEIYAKPFQTAINDAGLRGIMPCYCNVAGLPVHASRQYLTQLLREEMGFDGVVVSDYGATGMVFGVQHVGESMTEAGFMCMEAGMDTELPVTICYGAELKAKFESGEADIAVLDRAVLRVLEAKFRMGIFENPFSLVGEELKKTVLHEEDEDISMRAAQESITLLKNDGVLPLTEKEKKIAIIGPHGGNARYYFGGYTHLSMVESQFAAGNSMAGVGVGGDSASLCMDRVPGTNVQVDETEVFDNILKTLEPDCKNLVEEMKDILPNVNICYAWGYPKAGCDESGFVEALQVAKNADIVILTLGGKNGSGSIATMGEGVDGTNINLPACQDAFIVEVAKLGKPLIGVHFDGRPISSDVADKYLNAIIEAWTPAKYGARAVANILAGKYNPTGKLPVTVARNAGQLPIYYNHLNGSSWHQGMSVGFTEYVDESHLPRYCFGHGLSYTDFTYSDIRISKKEISADEEIDISCMIKNTGAYDGVEVVQLYLQDAFASVTRPVKELHAFKRVPLKVQESKKVVFSIHASQLAFLDSNMKWKIEKGSIHVQIGSSSEDIRLEEDFLISDDRYIDGRTRRLCGKAEIK
ncbi:MAG: glycoside hydrolase family 3 C-terminal domain-containing protein [Lachnospiraceae bacterium]|nr:glycoside hydrolase family 3 C-terminal domain-containing protein [Lachnospiraceae bacterium]